MSGRGAVYARTVIRKAMGPWAAAAPYVGAYVELEEGPRILTNVVTDDPDGVHIGRPSTATFVPIDDDQEPPSARRSARRRRRRRPRPVRRLPSAPGRRAGVPPSRRSPARPSSAVCRVSLRASRGGGEPQDRLAACSWSSSMGTKVAVTGHADVHRVGVVGDDVGEDAGPFVELDVGADVRRRRRPRPHAPCG